MTAALQVMWSRIAGASRPDRLEQDAICGTVPGDRQPGQKGATRWVRSCTHHTGTFRTRSAAGSPGRAATPAPESTENSCQTNRGATRVIPHVRRMDHHAVEIDELDTCDRDRNRLDQGGLRSIRVTAAGSDGVGAFLRLEEVKVSRVFRRLPLVSRSTGNGATRRTSLRLRHVSACTDCARCGGTSCAKASPSPDARSSGR